ncbi:hypothetical protein AK812_SmicGene14272 [Symbiodinium microadriaticum]|uniref:Uncharacterized protein n=1 Tax=Symbiodinium microadriaticum TaxID=2951 RepID=A0A1Q9E605_SYMMI|nr:hypothetical protein AK812_SmicGene14272 [Symbiodinium microadriaticum]
MFLFMASSWCKVVDIFGGPPPGDREAQEFQRAPVFLHKLPRQTGAKGGLLNIELHHVVTSCDLRRNQRCTHTAVAKVK